MYAMTIIDGAVTLAVKGRKRTLDAMESAVFRARMGFAGRVLSDKGNVAGIITNEKQQTIARKFLLPA